MERKINYTLVGLFITGSGVLLVLAILWLGRLQYKKEYDYYMIRFKESVSGLNVGSPVKYRGIKVGTVEKLSIDPQNPELVRVIIKVKKGTPILKSTRALLAYQGLTGLAYIELSGGDSKSKELLHPRTKPPYTEIKTKPSLRARLDQVITNLSKQTETLVTRINLLLSKENIRALSSTLKNLETVSGSLASQKNSIETTLENLAVTSRELPSLVRESREDITRISRKTQNLLDLITQDEKEVKAILVDVRQFMRTKGRTIADSAHRSLVELSRTLEETQETLQALRRTIESFENNPSRILLGGPSRRPGPGE